MRSGMEQMKQKTYPCILYILIFTITLFFCGVTVYAETPAKPGDTVSVYYSLSFPGGSVFESNINNTPLTFVLGAGAMIPGFDNAIQGMVPGETKTVVLTPDQAYGEKNDSLIRTVPLPEAVKLLSEMNMSNVSVSLLPGYPGPMIEYLPPEGKRQRYVFTNITNETVKMDTNRPLAGQTLQFEITLLSTTNN